MRTVFLLTLFTLSLGTCAQQGIRVEYRATNNAYLNNIEWLKSKNDAGMRSFLKASKDGDFRDMELSVLGDASVFERKEEERVSDDDGPIVVIVSPRHLGEGRTIFKNRKERQITIAQQYVGRTYILEDTMRIPSWKPSKERTTILGMECEKATCNDTVTAWYAIDIPIPDGPDIYWGLPGLILRLDDGLEQYECVAVEPMEDALPRIPRGKRMSPIEFDKFVKEDLNSSD